MALRAVFRPKCTRLQDFAYTISKILRVWYLRTSAEALPGAWTETPIPLGSPAFPLFLFCETCTDAYCSINLINFILSRINVGLHFFIVIVGRVFRLCSHLCTLKHSQTRLSNNSIMPYHRIEHLIVWWNAYFFYVRKWRNAYYRLGGDRWRTACVLWLAAVKIGGGDGDTEPTWVMIWAMNRRNKNDAAE